MNLSAPSRSLAALCLALAQGIALHAANAAVWYVDAANPSPQQDGASWATAFSTIQPAIDAAHADGGGEVWVAAGVYDEERVFVNEFNADAGSLELKGGVILIGGFAGDETEASQNAPSEHVTVIDGSKSRIGLPAANVVRVTGAAEIDGFTIIGGRAEEPIGNGGGGIYASSPIEIKRCVIKDNFAQTGGAAIRALSELIVESCVFENNSLGCIAASGPTIVRKCTFNNNVGPLLSICGFKNEVQRMPS